MDRNDNGLFFTATDEDYKLARSLGLTIEDIRECRQAEARRAFEATLAPKHSKLPGCSTNAHIDSSPASQLDEKDEKEEKELVELSRVLDIPVQVLREGRAAEKERQAAEDFNQRYNKQKASQTVIKGRVIDEDYDADDHLVGEGTKRVKKAKTKNYRRPAGPRNPATSFNTRGLSIIPEEDIEEGEPEEGYDLYKIFVRPLVPRLQTLEDIRGVLHRNGQRIIRRMRSHGYIFSIRPDLDLPFQGKFWDDKVVVRSMDLDDLEKMKRKTLE